MEFVPIRSCAVQSLALQVFFRMFSDMSDTRLTPHYTAPLDVNQTLDRRVPRIS
jgi:hypothetical protein